MRDLISNCKRERLLQDFDQMFLDLVSLPVALQFLLSANQRMFGCCVAASDVPIFNRCAVYSILPHVQYHNSGT